MKHRILGAIGVATVTLLAMAAPAFAWHVNSVTTTCQPDLGTSLVEVSVSDAGPGSYTDTLGNSGTFKKGGTAFSYVSPVSGDDVLTVVWATEETASFPFTIAPCDVPTTTTTEAPTTTLPPTTTTAPPKVYTSPPPAVPAPTTTVAAPAPPAPELATTGVSTAMIAGLTALAIILLGLGLALVIEAKWFAGKGK